MRSPRPFPLMTRPGLPSSPAQGSRVRAGEENVWLLQKVTGDVLRFSRCPSLQALLIAVPNTLSCDDYTAVLVKHGWKAHTEHSSLARVSPNGSKLFVRSIDCGTIGRATAGDGPRQI